VIDHRIQAKRERNNNHNYYRNGDEPTEKVSHDAGNCSKQYHGEKKIVPNRYGTVCRLAMPLPRTWRVQILAGSVCADGFPASLSRESCLVAVRGLGLRLMLGT